MVNTPEIAWKHFLDVWAETEKDKQIIRGYEKDLEDILKDVPANTEPGVFDNILQAIAWNGSHQISQRIHSNIAKMKLIATQH